MMRLLTKIYRQAGREQPSLFFGAEFLAPVKKTAGKIYTSPYLIKCGMLNSRRGCVLIRETKTTIINQLIKYVTQS